MLGWMSQEVLPLTVGTHFLKSQRTAKNFKKCPSLPPVSLLITSADVSAHQEGWREPLFVPAGPQAPCWPPEPFGCPWNGTEPGLAEPQAGGCHQGCVKKLLLAPSAPQSPCFPHSLSAPEHPSPQSCGCTDIVAITNARFRISALS